MMEDSGKPKKRRKKSRVEDEEVAEEDNVLRVHEFITVGDEPQQKRLCQAFQTWLSKLRKKANLR